MGFRKYAVCFALISSAFLFPTNVYGANPTISSLTPNSGAVGASVTIAGSNFGSTQGTSAVTFNGKTATASTWGAGSIVAMVPSGATTGNVVVKVGNKSSNGVSFTVVPAPSLGNLSATSGAVGASITISGNNFGLTQGLSTVKFNGVLATPTSWGQSAIAVHVPSGATTGNVVVHASGVDSNGVLFTVVPPPSIASLSTTSGAVGASVIISGNNFGSSQGSSTVKFNSTLGAPTSWGASSITIVVPTGATTGNVVVHANGVDSNGISFTVPPAPSISGLSQPSGPVGASITISGGGFGSTQGSGTLTFNGTAASVASWGASSITAPVPAGATTGNVVVYASGVNSNGVSFMVTPYIGNLSPSSGPVGTSVTITGTSFGTTQGNSTVKFNGTTATPTTWGDTSVVAPVPSGATSGNLVVTVNGLASNSVNFTVTAWIPPTLVSFSVNPPNATISIADTQPYTAIASYSDGSTQDLTSSSSWSSSSSATATIDGTGLVTAIADGQTTIQATAGSLVSSSMLTVTPSLITTPAYQSQHAGLATNQKQIALGLDGFPRLVVGDENSQGYSDIVYVRCLDADCATSNTNAVYSATTVRCCSDWSIAVGPDGLARIAFLVPHQYGFISDLYLIECGDNDCASSTSTLVDTEGGQVDSDFISSIVVGSNGTSYIVYDNMDDSNGLDIPYLKIASCNNGACATMQSIQVYTGYGDLIGAAIAVDSSGNPVVGYSDLVANQVPGSPPSTVHYFANGSNTVVSNDLGGDGFGFDMSIGQDGSARILFPNAANAGLNLATCNGTSCGAVSTISPPGYYGGEYFSIAVDGNGSPMIATLVGSYPTYPVDYIQCTAMNCPTYSVDGLPGNWGNTVSLNADAAGLPHILAQLQGPSAPIEHVRKRAIPVKFHLANAIDGNPTHDATPVVQANFAWESSTENYNDLSGCFIREYVTFPNTNNAPCPSNGSLTCFYPPSPPWVAKGQPGSGWPNPSDTSPGTTAVSGQNPDYDSVGNLNFVKPYSVSSFSGTQIFQYQCDGGSWNNLYGPANISYSMYQDQYGTWTVTVSRSDTKVTSYYVIP